jgi:hypothetical protein
MSISNEIFRQKQEAMSNQELYDTVDSELSKMCRTGGRSFTMTVPVSIYDTDMLICELLRRFKEMALPEPPPRVPPLPPPIK